MTTGARGAAAFAALFCSCGDNLSPRADLSAAAGESRYALVGEAVRLDGTGSTGAQKYQWSLGDSSAGVDSDDGIVTAIYPTPGRYQAVLTVYDDNGNSDTDAVVISVTYPGTFAGSSSSTVAVVPGTAFVAAVSPDSNELTIIERSGASTFEVARRVPTSAHPRTVTAWGSALAVVCEDDDVVDLVPLDGTAPSSIQLAWGSRPYGAAVRGDDLYVTLAGAGRLARITPAGEVEELADIEDPRGIATLPDGRLAVTRWRSPDDGAVITIFDPDDQGTHMTTLAVDPQLASDTEIGGLPSYLNQIVISPTGLEAAVPALQANTLDGLVRSGIAVRPDTTMRAIVSFIDLATSEESSERRTQFDNRGFAAASAYSSRGDYLFVAMPGNRAVARLDTLADAQSGSLADVGLATDGVAVTEDDRFLFVTAFMSREIVVYDMVSFTDGSGPVARLALTEADPLGIQELRGKQLFYDSFDPRLARDGYIACAHCHLDGDSDRRVWDFTDRGEGLRNTVSLLGRAGLGDGPLHWSANFDEVQDFEHDIRGPFGGTGLMSDADFAQGTRDTPLGDSKAGVSAELDALAAYVSSLDRSPRNPRAPAGVLSASAVAGKLIFDSVETGCLACHTGQRFTDSGWLGPGEPRLHDVGTLAPTSGQRLGQPLAGLDTPTLRGLASSAPYLHDGSAASLMDVLTSRNGADEHGTTSHLTPAELDELCAYLSSL